MQVTRTSTEYELISIPFGECNISTLEQLLNTLPQTGVVDWIGLRPARRAAMHQVERVMADTLEGLIGDRYSGRSGKRHVTLIQAEHLPVVASCLALSRVEPRALRRNLSIRGLNLLAAKGRVLQVGQAQLEITGLCHPCSYMEEVLGPGGYNAVRGHGGLTARVIFSGPIKCGDAVTLVAN